MGRQSFSHFAHFAHFAILALIMAACLLPPGFAFGEAVSPEQLTMAEEMCRGVEIRDDTLIIHEGVQVFGALPEGMEAQGLWQVDYRSLVLDGWLEMLYPGQSRDFHRIQLPSTLLIAEAEAFMGMPLTELILPEGLEQLVGWSFYDMPLETVALPSTLRTLPEGMFLEAANLRRIEVAEGSPFFTSVDGVLFSGDKSVLICYPAGKAGEHYDVPPGVKTIARSAFGDNLSLRSVSLPFGLETIDCWAFSSCYQLERVAVPLTLKTCGMYAFGDCISLSNIRIPQNVTCLSPSGEEIPWEEAEVLYNTPLTTEKTPEEPEHRPEEYFGSGKVYGIVQPESGKEAQVHAAPSENSAVYTELPQGVTLCLRDYQNGWFGAYGPWRSTEAYDMGYIPAASLHVFKAEENLFRITRVEPIRPGVKCWFELTHMPDQQPGSELDFSTLRGNFSIRGQWIEAESWDYFQLYLNPADLILYRAPTGDGRTYGIVITDDFRDRLNLRSEPSRQSASLGKYFGGTQLEILEENGDWYRVLISGQEGWVMKQFVHPVYEEKTDEGE